MTNPDFFDLPDEPAMVEAMEPDEYRGALTFLQRQGWIERQVDGWWVTSAGADIKETLMFLMYTNGNANLIEPGMPMPRSDPKAVAAFDAELVTLEKLGLLHKKGTLWPLTPRGTAYCRILSEMETIKAVRKPVDDEPPPSWH